MSSLRGLRVVVTRGVHQSEELAEPLRERGAEVLLLPLIEIAPPEDSGPLTAAAANCNRYDWIVFTSVNAVHAFASAMPANVVCEAKVATIGAATREACEQYGFAVVLTPAKYVAESLVEAFEDYDLHDHRVLIPAAAVTRDVVPLELRKLGALVSVVEAYRNVIPANAKALVEETICEPYPDWVLLASSSAVRNLVSLAGADKINRTKVASIGPATTATARDLGVHVAVEAPVQHVDGLVHAIEQYQGGFVSSEISSPAELP